MCRELGLRRGPELRFFKSSLDTKTDEIKKEFDQVIPDIAQDYIMNDIGLSKVNRKDYQEILDFLKEKAELKAENILMTNKDKLVKKSKLRKYQLRNADGKIIRKGRDEKGKRIRTRGRNKKKYKNISFWEQLED